MKKTLFLFLLLCMAVPTLWAQTRPDWIRKKPNPTNNTYFYDIGDARSSNATEALNRARAEVVNKTIQRLGLSVESSKVREALINGTPIESINSQYKIPVFEVCHWSEQAGVEGGIVTYRAWVLCQVAVSGNVPPQFDLTFNKCSSDHEFSTGWDILSSSLVPGLGQMGKRHFTEGVLTLGGELLLAGGGAATYFIGKDKLELIESGSLNYDRFTSMQKQYESLRTANRIFWGTAIAVYVLNIYRAATIHPNYQQTVFFEPSFINTPSQTLPSFGITLNF